MFNMQLVPLLWTYSSCKCQYNWQIRALVFGCIDRLWIKVNLLHQDIATVPHELVTPKPFPWFGQGHFVSVADTISWIFTWKYCLAGQFGIGDEMDHYTGHDLAFFFFLMFSAWRFHLLCNVHGNTLLLICNYPRPNRWNTYPISEKKGKSYTPFQARDAWKWYLLGQHIYGLHAG